MEYINKRDFILNGNMSKVILKLSVPVMLNNLVQTIYNLTDTFFVSKLGTSQLAAMQFTWPLIFLITSLAGGLGIAATALISQYIGEDKPREAKRVAGQSLSFTFMIAILFGSIGFLLTTFILKWMGGKGDLLLYSKAYLEIMFLGMPTVFLFFAFSAIKQGQGDMITPMRLSAMSVVLNLILDPIFIFTLGMGIRGAAIATVISRGFFIFYALWILFYSKSGISLNLKDLILDKITTQRILKIGLPSMFGQSMTSVGFAVMNGFIVTYGDSILSAFALGNRISGLAFMPAMGIGSALTTVVGQNLGANDINRVKSAFWTSLKMSIGFLVIGASIILLFSSQILGWFTKDPVVFGQGLLYMRVILFTVPLMGIYFSFIGLFQGTGHTKQAMVIMMGRLWILRIPLIIIFKHFTNWGASGIWIAMVISNVVICIVGFLMYLTGRWQESTT